jgi:uncharacterized protein
VDAKLGDMAKGWNDAQYAASFAALTKDVKPSGSGVVPLGAPVALGDAATAYQSDRNKRISGLRDAWRTPFNAADAAAAA